MTSIPARGWSGPEVLSRLEAFRARDLDWRSGRVFGYFYDAGAEAEAVGKEAYVRFLAENGLDPTVIPSPMLLENSVVDMCRRHLGGSAEAVGSFTTGGTESCMLAVKTARDLARSERGIAEPEIVLPETAHAAFHKGAHYFDVGVVVTPVDPVTLRADPQAIEEAITPRTALIVVSAPGYAHGVVDPVERIAAIAARRGVLCHVDGCIGAFLLPYFRRLGEEVPPFDLSVPGVTSISMDLHKYAFCPKPASVILYRDRELRRHQLFACSGWTGYTVVNPTFTSTKSGGPLAGAWATLHFLGEDGYLELARAMLEAKRRVLTGLESIPGLRVLGAPELGLIAVAGEGVSVFHVADEMRQRGWYVQPQLRLGRHPETLHLSINPGNVSRIGGLLADLETSVEAARSLPSPAAPPEVLRQVRELEGDQLGATAIGEILGALGISGLELPERMAPIHEVLNAMAPEVADRVLVEFLNQLYTPT